MRFFIAFSDSQRAGGKLTKSHCSSYQPRHVLWEIKDTFEGLLYVDVRRALGKDVGRDSYLVDSQVLINKTRLIAYLHKCISK